MEDGGLPDALRRQHLAQVLSEEKGGTQVLLRGLPGTNLSAQPMPCRAPTGTTQSPNIDRGYTTDRRRPAARTATSSAPQPSKRAGAALAGRPRLLTQFEELLQVNQRYAVIREEQARDFTLVAGLACLCPPSATHMVTEGDRTAR